MISSELRRSGCCLATFIDVEGKLPMLDAQLHRVVCTQYQLGTVALGTDRQSGPKNGVLILV